MSDAVELEVKISRLLEDMKALRGLAYKIMANNNFNPKLVAQASSVKVALNRYIPEFELLER